MTRPCREIELIRVLTDLPQTSAGSNEPFHVVLPSGMGTAVRQVWSASAPARALETYATPSAESYTQALDYFAMTAADVQATGRLNVRRAATMANSIAAEVRENSDVLRMALDRNAPFSLRRHSLNVCIIGAHIARHLGWAADRVYRVALGGMLHDIALARWTESGIWAEHDFGRPLSCEIRQVPQESAHLISTNSGFEWLSQIILQVGERENGTGYPNGLKQGAICDEALVLGAADVFETLLHRRRHREALTGQDAIAFLMEPSNGFPQWIVKAVVSAFSIYPVGEYVMLNTEELGVVRHVTGNAMRPVVSVIYSSNGEPMTPPRTVDLSRNSQVWITSAVPSQPLPRRRSIV